MAARNRPLGISFWSFCPVKKLTYIEYFLKLNHKLLDVIINFMLSFSVMENPEYFRIPSQLPAHPITLKRSLSDYQTNGSRPPLPPKKLGRSPSTEIAKKVSKFEQLAKEGSPPKDDINKGLWYYKDGLRSPSTPPPRSRSNSLSPSPLGEYRKYPLDGCFLDK